MKFTEKQKEIIELSKKMFSEKGYVETSMRDLAFQLDIKAASIYSHFKSKDEILQIICNEIYDNMERNIKIIEATDGGVEEKFLHYVKIHIESIIKDQKSFEIYYKYWNLLDSQLAGRYGLMNYRYFDFIKALVNGTFPKIGNDTSYIPDALPLLFIDLINSVPRLVNPENLNIEKVVRDVQMFALWFQQRKVKMIGLMKYSELDRYRNEY